jgi:transcriptional regulator with XRE-family HTH domain
MTGTPTPRAVSRAQHDLGAHLRRWRKLQQLSAAQVADRAGVSRPVVSRIENGEGTTLENLLRIARALGVLDQVVAAVDPMSDDIGRLRADEQLPQRVRPPRAQQTDDGGIDVVSGPP